MPVSQESLQALLDKWQPRLGLMHWKAQIKWGRHHEMPESTTLASVSFNQKSLRADILVQDPNDYVGSSAVFQHDDETIEHAVVHELLHLVLVPLCEWCSDIKMAENDLERTIHILERALVEGG